MKTTFRNHDLYLRDEGTGPLVVFLHNGGASHRIWDAQVQALAGDFRCVGVDLLGYGRSDKPRLQYTLPLYADMLEELLSSLGIERAILCGNCMGSATALHFALEQPDRVRGLFLCNLLTERTLSTGVFGPLHRAASWSSLLRALLARGVALPLPGVLQKWAVGLQCSQRSSLPRDLEQHLVSLYRDPAQVRVLGNLLGHISTFAVLDHAQRPSGFPLTYMLWGEHNRILPLDKGLEVAAGLRPDLFHTVCDAGHLPMAERPEEVTGLLRELLSAVPKGTAGAADQRDQERVA